METVEIITPSGHKVTLKARFTFGEKRQVEKASMSPVEIDPVTKRMKYDSAGIDDARDVAFKILIIKIIDKSGEEIANTSYFNTVMGWDSVDGEYLYNKIDDIINNRIITPEVKKN